VSLSIELLRMEILLFKMECNVKLYRLHFLPNYASLVPSYWLSDDAFILATKRQDIVVIKNFDLDMGTKLERLLNEYRQAST
jgi:hypothetical protein